MAKVKSPASGNTQAAGQDASQSTANGDGQEDLQGEGSDGPDDGLVDAEFAAAALSGNPSPAVTDGAATVHAAHPDDELTDGKTRVDVPTAFILTMDDHKKFVYPVGTYPMLCEHAEHWFSVAMGVKPSAEA